MGPREAAPNALPASGWGGYEKQIRVLFCAALIIGGFVLAPLGLRARRRVSQSKHRSRPGRRLCGGQVPGGRRQISVSRANMPSRRRDMPHPIGEYPFPQQHIYILIAPQLRALRVALASHLPISVSALSEATRQIEVRAVRDRGGRGAFDRALTLIGPDRGQESQ